jgi:hypothetical protein
MERARTSYEVVVARHVSPATLATFPVPLVPTAVPRNTVYRLRVGVGSDGDIADIVRRLTDRGVALLEIRRCPERSWWRRDSPGPTPADAVSAEGPAQVPAPTTAQMPPPRDLAAQEDAGDVVVPFPAALAPGLPGLLPADDGALVEPVLLRLVGDPVPRRLRRPRHRTTRD